MTDKPYNLEEDVLTILEGVANRAKEQANAVLCESLRSACKRMVDSDAFQKATKDVGGKDERIVYFKVEAKGFISELQEVCTEVFAEVNKHRIAEEYLTYAPKKWRMEEVLRLEMWPFQHMVEGPGKPKFKNPINHYRYNLGTVDLWLGKDGLPDRSVLVRYFKDEFHIKLAYLYAHEDVQPH